MTVLVGISHLPAHAASLTIEWDPPTDTQTSGYVVWYGVDSTYSSRADVGFVTNYRVEGLADATTYCFKVQAYANDGEVSELSVPVCATTAAAAADPIATTPTAPASLPPTEIALYAAKASVVRGNWAAVSNTSAAGGRSMRSADYGWSSPVSALASPRDYFELRFEAAANTPYRIWLRHRAGANSKWNDSVWVQFSDALVNGGSAYRIGTTSALLVNLENCSGCGTSGWGWHNTAYWLAQATTITFRESGTHTIRIQPREDGVEIDQIVLSAVTYRTSAPGPVVNDTKILSEKLPTLIASTPYSGTPVTIPGTIDAAYFDQGSAGAAYGDSSLGNAGGAFRTTDVDLQPSSLGGYNVGWTTAGEWLTYTINVVASGTLTASVRVASAGGGSVKISLGTPSNTARTVTVPNTGGWQSWTTVSVPITVVAGKQRLFISFPVGNVNLRSIAIK